MRFTSSAAFAAAMLMSGQSLPSLAAESAPVKLDHVRTVEDLLAAEAAVLQQKAKPAPEPKRSTVSTPADVDDSVSVESLWGYSGAKRALVSVNGVRATVAVGDRVGKYTVRHIGAGCVALESPLASVGAGKGKARRDGQRPPASQSPMDRVQSKTACFNDGGYLRPAPVVSATPISTGAASPLPAVPSQAVVPSQPVQTSAVSLPK